MQRRDLLKQAAAAATAAPFLPTGLGAVTRRARRGSGPGGRAPAKKVLVLGAGLAGLAAAYELGQAGHEVTVLEARLRAGGRVHTLRAPFADGLYAEAGAIFVPAGHAAVLKYARLFDLALDPIAGRSGGTAYYFRGQYLEGGAEAARWPLELTPEERRLGPTGVLFQRAAPALKAIGDPAAPGWPPAAAEQYDRVTLGEFLRQGGVSPDLVALLKCTYLDLYGDGLDTVSALFILRELAQFAGGPHGSYVVRGGTDRLPAAFAARLAGRIRYGAAIAAIEQDAAGVRVAFVQGGRRQTATADYAVCTLPFSCLRRVEIRPAFSAGKMGAIQQLPYTAVVRVYLQSRRRFWPEKDGGIIGTDLPVMWTRDVTFNQPGPRGLLESYMAGPNARRASAMDEPERIAFVAREMEKVHPGLAENLEGGASYDWERDEWTRGDYPWFGPGQLGALMAHIPTPEGRVYFAGDHTSSLPGWMQGALSSGVRAAEEIAAAASREE